MSSHNPELVAILAVNSCLLLFLAPQVQPLNFTELGAVDDQYVGTLIVKNSGSTVRFSVDVEAYPCPSVVWSLDGITLGPSNSTFAYNDPCIETGDRIFTWTFTLNVVLTLATSGCYMATFTNDHGSTSLPRTYITISSTHAIT